MSTTARPLEALLADLAFGLGGDTLGSEPGIGLRAASVEFDLPVETRVATGANGLIVLADLPRTRTRTAFDLPVGRLSVRLVAESPR